MEVIEILDENDGIFVEKDNKTGVCYFLFDEYEIHLNKIPPNTIQEWHYHSIIEEVLVVTKGDIIISWKDNNIIYSRTLKKGSLARVKQSLHTIKNSSEDFSEFIVFRMVPTGVNKRELIKNDKVTLVD